jgi:hypothetical protein
MITMVVLIIAPTVLFYGSIGFPPMPTWAMISLIVGWIVGWSGLGAWRMMTRDA